MKGKGKERRDKNGFKLKVCGEWGVDRKDYKRTSWQFISGSEVLQRPEKLSLWGFTNLTWAYL